MALDYTFEIDANKFLHALKQYPNELKKQARVAIKEHLVKIQTRAAIIHRYTARSGMLDKAYELIMESDFAGELELSKTISNAPYAHAIHDGRADWPNYKPDRFLFNSFQHIEDNEPFREVCSKIVNKTLIKSRLV